MRELQSGKYEFYSYEFDESETPTLEKLEELLRKAKARLGGTLRLQALSDL